MKLSSVLTRKNRAFLRKTLFAYFLLLPALAIYTVIILHPTIETLSLSLVKWDGVNPVKVFVGLSELYKSPE